MTLKQSLTIIVLYHVFIIIKSKIRDANSAAVVVGRYTGYQYVSITMYLSL